MLFEWCLLLRSLSTVLHSGISGTLLHLLSLPPQMPHVSMPSLEEEQVSCQDVTLPSGLTTAVVFCSLVKSHLLNFFNLQIGEMMPLGLGVFTVLVAWSCFCLPCSTFQKALSQQQQATSVFKFSAFLAIKATRSKRIGRE